MPLVGVNFDVHRSSNWTDHWWFQYLGFSIVMQLRRWELWSNLEVGCHWCCWWTVEVGSWSHYLQGFIHPRWCRISSINSTSCQILHLIDVMRKTQKKKQFPSTIADYSSKNKPNMLGNLEIGDCFWVIIWYFGVWRSSPRFRSAHLR